MLVQASLRTTDDGLLQLTDDLFIEGWSDVHDRLVIGKGFKTDLATMMPVGRYAVPAIMHDYLYEIKQVGRLKADYAFLKMMLRYRVPRWKACLMFAAVVMVGWVRWKGWM